MKNILGVVEKVLNCNVKLKYELTFVNKKYNKRLKKYSYITAHSDLAVKIGDKVMIQSCAPISKTKKYIVIEKKESL